MCDFCVCWYGIPFAATAALFFVTGTIRAESLSQMSSQRDEHFGSQNTQPRQTGRPYVMLMNYLSNFITWSARQSVFLLTPRSDKVDATVAKIDGSQ